ncbi:hypothetical protein ABPG72_016229 [Tetrahymena utriculariae]
MNFEVKREQEEPQKAQLDYFPLEFNEKYFNGLEDKEEYYLDVYRRAYEQIEKNQLKIYSDFPKQEIYQEGICFALKRQANSALDRIINNMNGSRFYKCEKGKVNIIGSLVYLDGFLRFDKRLGIRVVRVFSKSQQKLSQEVQNFVDIILVHIYKRDIQEFGNYKQRYIDEDFSKSKQTQQQHVNSNNMTDQMDDEPEIDESDQQYPPTQKQQKLGQQDITKYLKEHSNQEEFQYIQKPLNINDEKLIKEKPGNFNQHSLQNLQVDTTGNKQQLSPQQKEIVLQNNKIEQKQDGNFNLKGEQKINLDPINQVQQVVFALYMQNNGLQQQLIEQEIKQKKAELMILEQKLNKLVQEKELFTKQPQLLNINQILQNNQKLEEYSNQN